jgi:hypothetical protein
VDDLRKYKDAIMWGAKQVNALLPAKFYEMFDNFLGGYKKEWMQAKKNGKVDEMAADPIPVSLFRLLLKWALDANNIFVWFWTLLQWNFMARCASIDPLGLRHFTLREDSLVGKYDYQRPTRRVSGYPRKICMLIPLSGDYAVGQPRVFGWHYVGSRWTEILVSFWTRE